MLRATAICRVVFWSSVTITVSQLVVASSAQAVSVPAGYVACKLSLGSRMCPEFRELSSAERARIMREFEVRLSDPALPWSAVRQQWETSEFLIAADANGNIDLADAVTVLHQELAKINESMPAGQTVGLSPVTTAPSDYWFHGPYVVCCSPLALTMTWMDDVVKPWSMTTAATMTMVDPLTQQSREVQVQVGQSMVIWIEPQFDWR